MTDYHEPVNELDSETRNYIRGLRSLKEEIEAVDWYQQRISATDNEELASVLAHNRNEEMEHACMTLEWLRRNMPGWNDNLKTYLFTEKEITSLGEEEESEEDDSADESLNIGKL